MDQTPTHCPRCASTRIKPILETNYGWYWRCETCAEIWHQDTRRRPKQFEQRRTDILDALWAFLTCDVDFIRVRQRQKHSA